MLTTHMHSSTIAYILTPTNLAWKETWRLYIKMSHMAYSNKLKISAHSVCLHNSWVPLQRLCYKFIECQSRQGKQFITNFESFCDDTRGLTHWGANKSRDPHRAQPTCSRSSVSIYYNLYSWQKSIAHIPCTIHQPRRSIRERTSVGGRICWADRRWNLLA